MAMWNPWRGCHRYSDGCKFCYIHKADARHGIETENISKTAQFYAPIAKNSRGEYKIKSGQLVYLCFSTDFLVEEADPWREACWQMIKARQDLRFLFLTKRITRFAACMPSDWGDGYENVIVGCTVENQACADERLPVFSRLPIRHKNIICQPMLERITLEEYLADVELVVAGGESDRNARPLDYAWILDLRRQCEKKNVHFTFRQCGTHFLKDGRQYTLPTHELCRQARKARIDL